MVITGSVIFYWEAWYHLSWGQQTPQRGKSQNLKAETQDEFWVDIK